MGTRKGPTESATNFNIGTKKKGNDGNMWEIIKESFWSERKTNNYELAKWK